MSLVNQQYRTHCEVFVLGGFALSGGVLALVFGLFERWVLLLAL
ncbi:hypothetical protein MNBD_GAMMA13-1417 [hydrothermal vent metagenome]|uniref:Uncharacterized protein n=1 Tax=hydrothermal vent metagenome TaxID=652676 RepID=A0A3B0YJY2_9ZZZZ